MKLWKPKKGDAEKKCTISEYLWFKSTDPGQRNSDPGHLHPKWSSEVKQIDNFEIKYRKSKLIESYRVRFTFFESGNIELFLVN